MTPSGNSIIFPLQLETPMWLVPASVLTPHPGKHVVQARHLRELAAHQLQLEGPARVVILVRVLPDRGSPVEEAEPLAGLEMVVAEVEEARGRGGVALDEIAKLGGGGEGR